MNLLQLKALEDGISSFETLGVCANESHLVVLVFLMRKLIRFGKLSHVVHRNLFVVAAEN